MPSRLAFCLILGLAAFPSLGRADDFVWPGHGTVSFAVPAGWTMHGQPGKLGIDFQAGPDTYPAALLQITLANTPADRPVGEAFIKEQLEGLVQQYLAGSVEKKYTPHEIRTAQGHGLYSELTDARLVGKPPVPNDYKVMRNGLLALDEHALAVVTMQFDDPAGPSPSAMLAIVGSMRFHRDASSGLLRVSEVAGKFVIAAPGFRHVLTVPAAGLSRKDDRIGGATDSPRYFEFTNVAEGMILSGWIEDAGRYHGTDDLWKSETAAWARHGMPAPVNVTFVKTGAWDVISYELSLPRVTNAHVRAEWAGDGEWIDLHLSVTSSRAAAGASREAMLALLRMIKVSTQ